MPLRLFGWSLVRDNPEVKGYLLSGPARAPLFVSYAILSVAMLEMAFRSAGCTADGYATNGNGTALEVDGELQNCDTTTNIGFLEMKPDSLLSNISVVASLVNIVIIPMAGAIVDYSTYRKQVCIGAITVMWCVNLFQTFLGERTWRIIALCEVTIWLGLGGFGWGGGVEGGTHVLLRKKSRRISHYGRARWGFRLHQLSALIIS